MHLTAHEFIPFLETVLTPARLAHSLSVMGVMGELAEVYDLDPDLAQTIGVLHDAAKDLPEDQIQALITTGNIKINHPAEENYTLYLHGPVGAYFVHQELSIEDELILDAIEGHTYCGTGRYFDHPMSWCLRFADIIEPKRNWDVPMLADLSARLRELAVQGRMKAGAHLQTGSLIRWFDSQGWPVHPRIQQIHQQLDQELA